MRELKAHNINDLSLHDIANCDFYLKSEADKVIAGLKESRMAWIHRFGVAEEGERHQKYKRCLAMAKWCEERDNYLTCLEKWQMADKEYKQVIGEFWVRWCMRWNELAEKFKEAK